MARDLSRRRLVQSAAGGPFLARGAAPAIDTEYSLYWGDLHNHNAVGYAVGSIDRTYDIARSHLDFLAFTPHAQWHDMPRMPNHAEDTWVKGFRVTEAEWPKVQKLAQAHNQPGKFVSFLAYEWHSSQFGDHCVYYPDDARPLRYFDHVRDLQTYAKSAKAALIPHHLAYRQGWRGANWEYADPTVSPVMEIYSEHGLGESDRGPFEYISHSNGPRWTRNTAQTALGRGIRMGFIASSDDHLGYPGAYGEGVAGIWAADLSRASLWEALWARRTMAATGDRIRLIAKLNGKWMGSTLPFTRDRNFTVAVAGADQVEQVEIIRNGRAVHRYFPADRAAAAAWPGEVICRLDFGWGPWATLNMNRVCDWEATAEIENGRLLSVSPCFQGGPFDENRRNLILSRSATGCRFQLYTSRTQALRERPINSVVLHIAGEANSALKVNLTKPAQATIRRTLGELRLNNEIGFMGGFTSESFVVNRLVTSDQFGVRFEFVDRGEPGRTDWYYVRVTQVNGQMAWSSPFWVTA
jgi:hypothetical protein